MPNFESFTWKSSDGDSIYSQKWITGDSPKAIIVIVHGLGEHIGRYHHVADYFIKMNISLYGFDLRGHGKSSGKRGHIASNHIYFSDIDTMINLAKKDFPGIPIFIYGHSLGGNMVLNYSLKMKPDIRGVICTSPGLAVGEPVPPVKLFLAKILKSLLPSMTMDNGLDVNNLSHDPEIIQKYKDDPLVHPMISAKLAMDMFANGEWVLENAEDFQLPLLLMAGSEDHIVNLEVIKQFAKKVPGEYITFEIFEGFFHEIHNEYEKENVFQIIFSWISSTLE